GWLVRERRTRLDALRRRARRLRERELPRELVVRLPLALPARRQLGDDGALLRQPQPADDPRLRRERRVELLAAPRQGRLPWPARNPRHPRRRHGQGRRIVAALSDHARDAERPTRDEG